MNKYRVKKLYNYEFVVVGKMIDNVFYSYVYFDIYNSDFDIKTEVDEFMYIMYEMEYVSSFTVDYDKFFVYSYHNTDDMIIVKVKSHWFKPVIGDYAIRKLQNVHGSESQEIYFDI